jgi:nitroimidazol reductase NimA-like FMN-containing flavoprotein (pyridoxamine 5'-phosphate oxidase superfamily)
MSEIDAFLDHPFLARFATVNPKSLMPHVVPVWYAWDGHSLWISAFRSTRKVKELIVNPRCSVVIDVESAPQAGGLVAVLMEGEAELVTSPQSLLEEKTTWVYTRYLGPQGVLAADPQSWIKDPENLLIKLTPSFVKTWK